MTTSNDRLLARFEQEINEAQRALVMAAIARMQHHKMLNGARGERLQLAAYDEAMRDRVNKVTEDALDRLTDELAAYACGPRI